MSVQTIEGSLCLYHFCFGLAVDYRSAYEWHMLLLWAVNASISTALEVLLTVEGLPDRADGEE